MTDWLVSEHSMLRFAQSVKAGCADRVVCAPIAMCTHGRL